MACSTVFAPQREVIASATADVVNALPPIQDHLPILIGGGGPKVTLRLVAECGDMCNLIGTPDEVSEKEAVLLEHCEAVGRDHTEIERTVSNPQPIVRDSRVEAEWVVRDVFAHNGAEPWPGVDAIRTPDDLVDRCAPYVAVGYRHPIFQFLAPFDAETMKRLVHDVKPRLQSVEAV